MTRKTRPHRYGWHLAVGLLFGSITTLLGVCLMVDPYLIFQRAATSCLIGVLVSWFVALAVRGLALGLREP